MSIKNDCKDIYYFDNNATTLVYDNSVKDEINEWISCGNPSNILHQLGKQSFNKIEQCREIIAKDTNCNPENVIFTSCATESNNLIINSILKSQEDTRFSILTTTFEHPSVINIYKRLEEKGINVIYVMPCVDKTDPEYARVKTSHIETAIKSARYPVVLMSVMFANNEIGSVQDIEAIGQIARKYNIYFHCDGTQAIGKFKIDILHLNVDAFVFSGHKFHAPKGIGCIVHSGNKKLTGLFIGGKQEDGVRPGTENVAFIAGMTKALEIAHTDRTDKNMFVAKLKNWIIENMKTYINIQVIKSDDKYMLPNTIFVILNDLQTCNRKFVEQLGKQNICVSMGSACQTSSESSHVLDAVGITKDYRSKIIRISLSDYTTFNECRYLVVNIIQLVKTMK